jgi:hypothetical protein
MKKLAIALLLIVSPAILSTAQAQYQTPFPGIGPLYGNGTIQGGRSQQEWDQVRRDHGLPPTGYGEDINRRVPSYQSLDPYQGPVRNGPSCSGPYC